MISILSPIIGTSTTRMRTIYCVIIITIIQLQSYDKYTTTIIGLLLQLRIVMKQTYQFMTPSILQ